MGKDGNTKLRQPDIRKVDLVDDGANPGAKIALFKRNAPPEANVEPQVGILKRILDAIGITKPEDITKALAECAKSDGEGKPAPDFAKKLAEVKFRRVTSEIWDVTYALQDTLAGIAVDSTIDVAEKKDLMAGSLDQFREAMDDYMGKWCGGETIQKYNDLETGNNVEKAGRKINGATITRMKEMHAALGSIITEAEGTDPEDPKGNPVAKINDKEAGNAMFDKTLLSPEGLAYVETLEKAANDAKEELAKAKSAAPAAAPAAGTNPAEDVFKGLSPELKARIEDLQKRADKAEESEFITKAKAYESLGAKADELGPVLKTLSQKDPEGYAKIENLLKAASEAVAKGDLFKQLGSDGAGSTSGSAVEVLEKRAVEIAKKDGISQAAAMVKAGNEDPELLAKYRKELNG